ncbi:sugar kinase [Holotrichia oblita]|nr:sugar kinase [Holotrichia oblita]
MIGPNAVDIDDKYNRNTTAEGLNEIFEKSQKSVPSISKRDIITQFSGLRAHLEGDDFVVGETEDGFFNAAGIESPGLTSAPAIAKDLADKIAVKLKADSNKNFSGRRKGISEFNLLSTEQRQELIKSNSQYGRIVCRCENVTEGEIVEAIRRIPGARSIDGVKRRTRAGMGRCQSGEETMIKSELVIIGGGPAGLSAAIAAYDSGIKDILILEREDELGGILNQCIHNGFGLHTFKEELTGPEYAERYIKMVNDRKIAYKLATTVLDITPDKVVTAVNSSDGLLNIQAKAVIISCGCRERPRGAINIAGARLAGIYSAGTAQKYVNMMGYMPGKKVVILGSGDIGLIMARRMKFEGADVLAVVELMPYSSGLNRNIVQCLNDFDIPLYFNHTVVEILGKDRVESVAICEVDKNLQPKYETKKTIECDTLLLSVGLKVDTSDSADIKVTGNSCKRGITYGIDEVTNPKRMITSTMCVLGGRYPMTSVKTAQPVEKTKIFDVLEALKKVEVNAPVTLGQIAYKNIADTGVDIIGTTSSRCIVFDAKGNIVAKAQQEFKQIYPMPGWVEHNPQDILSSQISVAKKAVKNAGISADKIDSIGITNQRETVIVWNKNTGKPIYNAIVWQCRRSADLCNKLKEQGHEPLIYKKTGLVVDSYFSASKIKWILDNVPEARASAERGDLLCGAVDTWLLWHLTGGKVHATDYTNASRTMLFNIHDFKWDSDLLKLFDIPVCMLPEVHLSAYNYGAALKKFFGREIPIAGIAGDQQSALFGQLCLDEGSVKNTYGTGCFLLMHTGSYDKKENYALEGSVFIGGAVIQWLRDEMKIIKTAVESEKHALEVPDSAGIYVVPAFVGLGAPHWDSDARGTVVGLTRGTNIHHFVRACLESIAYQTFDVLHAMEQDIGKNIFGLP